jgi:site-specific DNA-methyltransferase (adenine-specific)
MGKPDDVPRAAQVDGWDVVEHRILTRMPEPSNVTTETTPSRAVVVSDDCYASACGRVTLYHGDCLDVLPTVGPVDACITDPPYGITSNEWDDEADMERLFPMLHGVCEGAICMTGAQPFTAAMVMANRKNWRHEWVWRKNRGSNFANTVREPFKEHETVQVFAAGKWIYNPQRQARRGAGSDRAKYECTFGGSSTNYREMEVRKGNVLTEDRVPSSVQDFNTETGMHPTQKPVLLMRYLIRTYTNDGDAVLDPFMGSGTTGVAAIREGRRFVGVERDPVHYATALERIKNELAQGDLFLGHNTSSANT